MDLHKLLFDEMNEEFWGIPRKAPPNVRRRSEPTPRFLTAIGEGVRATLEPLASLFRPTPATTGATRDDPRAAALRIVSGGRPVPFRSDLDRAA